MEEYIPPVEAAAPGDQDNPRETDPNLSRSGAAFGEMQLFGPSMANSNFDDPDSRRDTFSNEDAIVGQLDDVIRQREFVSSPMLGRRNVLDMSNPSHSAPGADFLLAAEYVVGGVTYDVGEVLDANSFPDLESERNRRISEILRNLHRQRNTPPRFVPKALPINRPSVGMTRDSFIREENLRRWKEELFDASFYHTNEPNNPVRVRVSKLKTADGRVFRKGQSIDQKFVTLHIDSTIRDTTRADSSRRLSRPLRSAEETDSVSSPPVRRETAPTTRGRQELPTPADNVSVLSGGSGGSGGNDERRK